MTHGRRRDPDSGAAGQHSPLLLIACALTAILGTLALAIGNVVGSIVVPGHDWVAHTVSDLAAGRYEIIQDVALYGYAAGFIALAIGAAHLHLGAGRWSVGILCLALVGCAVVVIGARNEYGDGDSEGVVVHTYVVVALGVLLTAAPLLMAEGLSRVGRRRGRLSLGLGIAFGIGAPPFFFMPTSIDGAWERGLGLVSMAWVLLFGWTLLEAGRAAMRQDAPARTAGTAAS